MLTLEQIQSLKDDNMDTEGVVNYRALDSHLLPMETALEVLPEITLSEHEVKTLRYGQPIPNQQNELPESKAYMEETGEFIGVVYAEGGEIKSRKLVVTQDFL
jgi:tRNA pseudouridine55 synthase